MNDTLTLPDKKDPKILDAHGKEVNKTIYTEQPEFLVHPEMVGVKCFKRGDIYDGLYCITPEYCMAPPENMFLFGSGALYAANSTPAVKDGLIHGRHIDMDQKIGSIVLMDVKFVVGSELIFGGCGEPAKRTAQGFAMGYKLVSPIPSPNDARFERARWDPTTSQFILEMTGDKLSHADLVQIIATYKPKENPGHHERIRKIDTCTMLVIPKLF